MEVASIRGYITKRPNGLYLVTKLQPQITEVKLTNKLDVYITYGDPLGFLNIDQIFIDTVYGKDQNVEPLKIYRMRLNGGTDPITHYITKQENNLYQISTKNSYYNNIKNVCPWFIGTLFKDVDLTKDIKAVYFSGELI